MTFNVDNLLLFYIALGIYGLGLTLVAHAALAGRAHKSKRRDHWLSHR